MTVVALLATCVRCGITLAPDGDAIRFRGPRLARDELLPEIRRLKPALLEVLRSEARVAPGKLINLAGPWGGRDALPN